MSYYDIVKIPTHLDNIEVLHCVTSIYKNNINYDEWYLTEKLKGIHISIITDGFFVSISNNKYKSLINKYFSIIGLYQSVINRNGHNTYSDNYIYEEIKSVQVSGYLIGGIYNHKDIKNNNIKSIFKRPYYNPGIIYVIDDIIIITKNEYKVLNYFDTIEICKENNLIYNKIIKIGNLYELYKTKAVMSSTIYNYFNLPKINNNVAYGIIIKSFNSVIIHNNCWARIEKNNYIPKKIVFIDLKEKNKEMNNIILNIIIKMYLNENKVLLYDKSKYKNIINIINFIKKNYSNEFNYNNTIEMIINIFNYLKI